MPGINQYWSRHTLYPSWNRRFLPDLFVDIHLVRVCYSLSANPATRLRCWHRFDVAGVHWSMRLLLQLLSVLRSRTTGHSWLDRLSLHWAGFEGWPQFFFFNQHREFLFAAWSLYALFKFVFSFHYLDHFNSLRASLPLFAFLWFLLANLLASMTWFRPRPLWLICVLSLSGLWHPLPAWAFIGLNYLSFLDSCRLFCWGSWWYWWEYLLFKCVDHCTSLGVHAL